MATTKILETDRLMLREIRNEDFDELYRMNSDPEVMKYVGDGTTRNYDQMEKEIDMLMSHYIRKPGLGIWGYATEASYGLLNYGFATLKLAKIVSSAHVDNIASQRVMQKIGMKYIDNRVHYGCLQTYYEIQAHH
jgi:RimJ/RimL family protein N-acetyltransferase